MSETNPSPPPEQPAPGLRLKAPGSKPNHPEPDDPTRSEPNPTSPSRPTAEEGIGAEIPSLSSLDEDSSADYDDPSGRRTTESSSSTTSTSRRPAMVDPALFADDLAQMVGGLAQAANSKFADGTELYLTTDDEERGIGEPLAGMLARRIPAAILGRGDDPDLADALRAVITVCRYTTRQIRMRLDLRRQARGATTPVDDALGAV